MSKSIRLFLVALMAIPLSAAWSAPSSAVRATQGVTAQAVASQGVTAQGVAAAVVPTTVRVATWNVQVRRPVSDFTRGVVPLAARSDIIGLQEVDVFDKELVLRDLADDGWSYHRAKPSSQMPILWRKDRFTFVSARSALISQAASIGYEVPGMKPNQHARYATVVRLVDKVTGRRLSVVNAHLLSGAVRGGRPWVGRPRTFALYRTGLLGLRSVAGAERAWGRVFVMGDFNAGWVADQKWKRRYLPIKIMGGVGMTSMWGVARPSNGLGTRNDALIDQVFTNLRPLGTRVQFDLSGFSDHRPAISLYPTV